MGENKKTGTLKLLCSYNGIILPPRLEGSKLRYSGGLTRVLTVDRSISYSELMVKIGEFCGFSAVLRCQLPGGDLDTLVTIASDEDLKNLIEEYDRISHAPSKIRAVLFPIKQVKTVSPPLSVDFGKSSPAKRFLSRSPPQPRFSAGDSRFGSPTAAMVTGARHCSPCLVEERSARVLNHHHHQHRVIPRSYYWQ